MKFQSIIMVNGTTCVADPIYFQQEKSANILSLQKLPALIGEVILKMKCFKEFMERLGLPKKN